MAGMSCDYETEKNINKSRREKNTLQMRAPKQKY